MPPLSHSCSPTLDRSEKLARHETEIRRLESLLLIKSLPDERRQDLQVELLKNHQAAAALRKPVQKNTRSRKRSFVGMDPYMFDG